MQDSYDYVIVGGGSSGCALAYRLTEDPNVSVLLIESGPEDSSPFIAMPMGIGKLTGTKPGIGDSPYLSYYTASKGGNHPEEIWFKGRTLGGSSSVNGMVYVRGTPRDYDGWAEAGCPDWGWNTVGRCFTEIENHQLGAKQWRGGAGPLRVTLNPTDKICKDIIAAAAQAGTPSVPDINDVDAVLNGGFGPQPRTIWRGQRFSAARAFLKPARQRRNLDVMTDTDVLNVTFDERRATGVCVQTNGETRNISAKRETILCAGAIHSPKLLQLSGIGPTALLESLGIPVRVAAPGVGKNLQEHRTIVNTYRLKHGGRNSNLRGFGLFKSLLSYALLRRGALSNCIWEVGGFVKTMPHLPHPDCQIGVGPFTLTMDGVESEPGLTLFGYVLRPDSRGEISITSPDPRKPPRIMANYLTASMDRDHTVALYRYMRTICEQSPLKDYIQHEILPGPARVSNDDLVDAAFTMGTCAYHVSGTCRMGSDDEAVLDPQLRVRGVMGLRVADTSIMPTLISANTNGAAMVIGWRAAELIKAG